MREIKSKVQFNNEVARDTYLMGLKVEDEEFLAEPGQFVMLRLSQATDPLLRRPFS
ncbi:MAG: NAD-dependent dihydroorotate dehydrogenase B electron transfer subunit, partial [Deltaproteobacteria bacterium]